MSFVKRNQELAQEEINRLIPETLMKKIMLGLCSKSEVDSLKAAVLAVETEVARIEATGIDDQRIAMQWVDGQSFNPYLNMMWDMIDLEKLKVWSPPEPLSPEEKQQWIADGRPERELNLPLKSV